MLLWSLLVLLFEMVGCYWVYHIRMFYGSKKMYHILTTTFNHQSSISLASFQEPQSFWHPASYAWWGSFSTTNEGEIQRTSAYRLSEHWGKTIQWHGSIKYGNTEIPRLKKWWNFEQLSVTRNSSRTSTGLLTVMATQSRLFRQATFLQDGVPKVAKLPSKGLNCGLC